MSRINYQLANETFPRQTRELNRAMNTKDPDKVREVCRRHVDEWNIIGAWPDNWTRWERALNDLLPWHAAERLDDL